jgi:DNA repair protein RadA/Sms
MPKPYTRFVCQQCGRVSASYIGKCPQCGAFNSMLEEIVRDEPASAGAASMRGLTGRSQPRPIGEIGGDTEDRIALPIGEFARVLGGGIVPGSIVLIGGDPGIGKSTLVLQMAIEMAAPGALRLGRGLSGDQDAPPAPPEGGSFLPSSCL